MKPSSQSTKSSSSSNSNSKSKKNSKDRDKRKSQGNSDSNNHNSNDKGSPSKDSRLYAGIDAESLSIYAEQNAIEHISEEISNLVTEDLNYRLRYIINDALLKSRLAGKNTITSEALEQTFNDLNIDRIYGCPEKPNWVSFGYQNLYYLEDQQVNLVELATEENTIYHQPSDPLVESTWVPEVDDVSKSLTNYFTTICEMVVSKDGDLRSFALKNISENSSIGPITDWFYKFAYILLSKDITYDRLTMRALGLISALESSPICRITVSQNLLKLLVRLILQRLLRSQTTTALLKPMCTLLAYLCWRPPLRDFVLSKIVEKISKVYRSHALPIITAINSLGFDAVETIFIPYMYTEIDRFLIKIPIIVNNFESMVNYVDLNPVQTDLTYAILEVYYSMHRWDLLNPQIYATYYDVFGDVLVLFPPRISPKDRDDRHEPMNIVKVWSRLALERRKLPYTHTAKRTRPSLDDVFELPDKESEVGRKLEKFDRSRVAMQSDLILGKTSLLLPVLRRKRRTSRSHCDNSLANCNF